MSTLGPIYLTTINGVESFGVQPWEHLNDAAGSDGLAAATNCSNYSGDLTVRQYSHYLRAVGGDFSALPDQAVILGITPYIERYCRNAMGGKLPWQHCHDIRVRLVKSGALLECEMASSEEWPVASATRAYPGGLWGAAWTAADIKAADFGVALAVESQSGDFLDSWFKAFVDSMAIAIDYCVLAGEWTAGGSNGRLTVDSSGITVSDGYPIDGFTWQWGDGSAQELTPGTTASHRYAAGGLYPVTLTVRLQGGFSVELTKEVNVASITSISPLMATRGASGTLITITGAGFGATQDTGTVTIGGVNALVAGWGATEITCRADDDPPTPLGAQDIVVTPAGGIAVTAQHGAYLYDGANNKAVDAVELGIVDEVFLNGAQVGFTRDALEMTFRSRAIEFEPADRFDTVQVWTYTGPTEVRVTFAQLDGALLATLLGGSYDSTHKVVTVAGNSQYADASLAIKEASGVMHVFKRVKVSGDVSLALNKEVKSLPVSFRVLSLNDAGAKKYECSFPA